VDWRAGQLLTRTNRSVGAVFNGVICCGVDDSTVGRRTTDDTVCRAIERQSGRPVGRTP